MPIYVYRCSRCKMTNDIFAKMSEIDDVHLCPRWSCGTEMERQVTAPNINNGTKSSNAFASYRQAFGKSVDSWNNVGDMDKHIAKKNKEFGLNIEPLGN